MRKRAQEPAQQPLALPMRGGRRPGAGRPSSRATPSAPHVEREDVRPYQPVHVTLRMVDSVWNLRSERSFAAIHAALASARSRPDARVVHFSIQGNHIHLIVEAAGTSALSNAIRGLSIRIARRLNRMMGRSGSVFEDRFHSHVLRTPTEVRNALRYVLGNFASHAARRGEPTHPKFVDRFSSAVVRAPRTAQIALFAEPAVQPARTWLIRRGGGPLTLPSPMAGSGGCLDRP